MNAIGHLVVKAGSLKAAAMDLGLSEAYVSLLKDGHRDISVNVAKKLSKITGKPWYRYL